MAVLSCAFEGRSMYPTLRNGERVLVSPVAYDELVIGDLIVFHDGRGLLCHRLIRKTNRTLSLKGDTNLWADPPIPWSQALGRVTSTVEPDLRLRSLDTPRQQRAREPPRSQLLSGGLLFSSAALSRALSLVAARHRVGRVANRSTAPQAVCARKSLFSGADEKKL